MVKKNILYTIGSTPMVKINALCPNPRVNIYAKLEGFNPTGSIKDRIAVRMVEAALKSGELHPGKTIIEPTSGNTGIGLAIAGIVLGFPVEICDEFGRLGRAAQDHPLVRRQGHPTPADEGTDGAIRPPAWWPRTPTNTTCPTSLPTQPTT